VALLNGLGLRLSKAGQTLQAAAAYAQGLAIAREIESADSVGPGLETNYAKLLIELGRPREAIPLFENAMTSATQRGHERSIGLVSLLLAPAWCAERDLERCQRLLDSARAHMEATLPRGHAMLGTLEMEEAGLALDRHQPSAAREHLQRGLSIFEAAKEWNPNRLRTLTWLALAELELGDLAAATGHADQAVAQSRATLGGFVHSAWLGEALVVQAQVRRARGDASGAREALEAALTQLHDTTGDAAPVALEALRMR
jgi:tetratricopeptide (TPR) repeat protein